jgi:hypothetical protein
MEQRKTGCNPPFDGAINAPNSRLTAGKARLRLFGGKDFRAFRH